MARLHPLPKLNRRDFLCTGTAAVASLASFGCKSLSSNGRSAKRVPVGAHVWVYAAKQPQYDVTPVLPQIFADLKYAGLDGIELMHNVLREEESVARIEALSREHELPVMGTSFSGAMWNQEKHAEILEDAEKVLRNLARLQGRTFGISVGAAPQKKTEDQLDAQADLLCRIMRIASECEVEPNLHNHTYEVTDDLHDLKGTLARVPDLKLGPDLNWLVRGGVDPAAFIRQYGPRIVFLHLRDQYRDGRWSEALGEGDMDYDEIARALQEMEFSGTAVIELAHESDFQPTRPLRESWRMSREFVGVKLGY